MTEEQLSELLSHPRLHALIDRRANDRVLRALEEAGVDMSYKMAAKFIGCPYDSIRTYLCRGQLVGGKTPKTISIASAQAFRAEYRPRPKSRRSRS